MLDSGWGGTDAGTGLALARNSAHPRSGSACFCWISSC